MPQPNKPKRLKPWLIVWKADYVGSFPTWMECDVCDIGYRPQSVATAVRFLNRHRHCGL